jgi:hypothetical protein
MGLVATDPLSNQVTVLLNDGNWDGMAPGRRGSHGHQPHTVALRPALSGLVSDPRDSAALVLDAEAGPGRPTPEQVPAQPSAPAGTGEVVPVLARLERHPWARWWSPAGEESLPEEGLTDLPD